MENTITQNARHEHISRPILKLDKISVFYQQNKTAVDQLSADILRHQTTAIIGPSGCGKSTLLRAINRMHELYPDIQTTGDIQLNGVSLMAMDAIMVRRKIGMVFQRPNPFPMMSIRENILAGHRLTGHKLKKADKEALVKNALESVALWDEVKDVLDKRGSYLSGGQQQRLCIARTIAMQPEVILMDEPTSALDPIATARIEELIGELKKNYTIVMVTHNMAQASRIADMTMFMYLGQLIEMAPTPQLFTQPKRQRTKDYLTGVFS